MTHGRPRVIAGIDEAGLGPLLGPFALGFAAFAAPDGGADLARRLAPAVSTEPRPRDGRLAVADSKRVYDRSPAGRRRLEATALAFLAQLDPRGRPPADAEALLRSAPPSLRSDADALARHPWYAALPDELPQACGAEELASHAERLAEVGARQEVRLVAAGLRLVPAGELNASFARTSSKSATAWAEVERVLEHLWTSHSADGCVVWVDRQGARKRHAELLVQALFPAAVQTLEETNELSAYRIEDPGRWMEVRLATRAEDRALPTALASCLAKYGRELAMDAFNAWFGALQSGLAPTAGYVTDARRWLRDAAPALARSGVEHDRLVRSR